MSRPTYMSIDLDALKANLARVREFAPHQSVIAMVKANAYGHGIERVAQGLSQAESFGVASIEEGIRLREAGCLKPIVLIEGVFYADELLLAAKHHFTLVVHHSPHLDMLEKIEGSSVSFPVWLKINTGMHRLGIHPRDINAFYQRLQRMPAVQKPIGLMTHFAEADRCDGVTTAKQVELFNKITTGLQGPRTLANSAGILAYPNALGSSVRPGLMLYGASPFPEKTGLDYALQPVMTLWSRLIAITQVERGGKVGYGGTWTAPHDMTIGIVGVGYGDGYPQGAENGTPLLVNGIECPLVGRVSMDMLSVDLRRAPHAAIGDPVVLWGKGLPVERVAQHCHTSAWEILTRMTPRPKVEVKG
jgi:alanine racemase